MKQNENISIVRKLMLEFAYHTELLSAGPPSDETLPHRYLWTDAFAVCNFLELYRQTGDGQFRDLALSLVEEVHYVLGRHRTDDIRTGWISGLDEQKGLKHPTIGGLRIGKKLKERGPNDPIDEDEEWDRDGQYYHYLTKWMHALDLVSRATGDAMFTRWAIELAKTAHVRFTYLPMHSKQKRMYWKRSIDLSYPLVSSMGQHDPLDGFITYLQLEASAATISQLQTLPDLSAEIADMAAICRGKRWATNDPLGIGGLLSDACRLANVMMLGVPGHIDLIAGMLDSAAIGLRSYLKENPLKLPAYYRLAFRELGLSIGLHGLEKLFWALNLLPDIGNKKDNLQRLISSLMDYIQFGNDIEQSWLDPANRRTDNWMAHRDINTVMLATSLAPDGYIELRRSDSGASPESF